MIEADRLRELFLVYGSHIDSTWKCDFLKSNGYADCNCGYVEVIKELEVKNFEQANAYSKILHKLAESRGS
jgi:hypothetical protein